MAVDGGGEAWVERDRRAVLLFTAGLFRLRAVQRGDDSLELSVS